MQIKFIFIISIFISTPLFPFWGSFFPESSLAPQKPSHPATILLVPFGNNSLQGRSLKSNFEYIIAHQFVDELHQQLATVFPEARFKISHEKQDVLQPTQLATMANCLATDLVIQFHFYHEPQAQLYLYHCSTSNDFLSKCWDLSWCHTDEAYIINKKKSSSWATKIADTLANPDNALWFTVHGPYAIPLKPMIGIIAPSLLLEIGLPNDDDWKQFVAPIVAGLKPIINDIIATAKQETA